MIHIDKIQSDVMQFLESECGLNKSAYNKTTALFSEGHLDSMNIVGLINFCEKNFSIKIAPLDVGMENFDTIEKLSKFIKSKT